MSADDIISTAKLQEELAMLSAVFSTVPVGVCVTDCEGRYVKVNAKYCDISGYDEEELLGQHFTIVVPRTNRTEATAMYRGFVENGEEVPKEWTMMRKDHQARLVRTTIGRVSRDDGRVFQVTVVQDVTELRRVQREREIYYHSFRDSIHPVVITDRNGWITHVNGAFEDLYGYTEAEAIGNTPRILNPGREVYRDLGIDDDAYDRLFGTMWRNVLNPRLGFWEGDLHNRKKDGSLVTVHLFISSVRDETGEPVAFFAMPMDVTKQREKEFNIRLECYRALNELAATRDKETGGHLKRIAQYTRILAEQLKMPKRFVHDIEIFSPLHDIGKVGIPDKILLADRDLTPEEFEIMRTHVTLGHDILQGRPTLEMAADIAGNHHEKWDGSGYPRGFKGEEIPLAARIMAVADVYDALRSKRHYKGEWSHEEAVRVIHEGRGTHFDPQVVDAFDGVSQSFQAVAEELRDW